MATKQKNNSGASVLAVLSTMAFGVLGAAPVWAQDAPPPVVAPPVTPPVAAPAQTPPSTTALSEPTDADFVLFKRAVARMRTTKGVSVKSDMVMTGASQGMAMTYKQTVAVTGKFPGKFRADVQVVNSDGTTGAKYLVVGDGLKAWTFRPGTNQYHVRSLSAFHAANDEMPSLGILCGLVTSTPEFGDLAVLKLGGGTVQASGDEAGGTRTFHIGMGKDQPTITITVNAQTAAFTKLALGGKDAQTTFSITETVSNMSDAPTITPDLFVWTPPKGAAKVAGVPIGPF